jgi:uncharacterized membrane protein YhaH (DUF805 family)
MHQFGFNVASVFLRVTDYRGRSDRPEYWYFFLFTILVYIIVAFVDELVMRADGNVAALFFFLLLIPSIPVTVRRLHDIGRSGWWVLIGLIPVLGALVLLYWTILPGNDGANAYGLAPD